MLEENVCSAGIEWNTLYVSVVQSLIHVQLFVTPWTAARQAFLSFTISQSLLKLMAIESVMPPNHLILCGALGLLPSVFPGLPLAAACGGCTLLQCVGFSLCWLLLFRSTGCGHVGVRVAAHRLGSWSPWA